MVPGKLRHSPKAPELLTAEPGLWLTTPSSQASRSWPRTPDYACGKLESETCLKLTHKLCLLGPPAPQRQFPLSHVFLPPVPSLIRVKSPEDFPTQQVRWGGAPSQAC